MTDGKDLLVKCSAWPPKAMEEVVTSVTCKKAVKDTLALLLATCFILFGSKQRRKKQLKTELSSIKSQLVENQKWVISL
jgi:hypothetical protein